MLAGYSAFVVNEFSGLRLYEGDTAITFKGVPPGVSLPHAGWSLGVNVGALAGAAGVLCLLLFLVLAFMARIRRL